MAYGLRPVQKYGQGYNNGGFDRIPILDAYAVNIFYGDFVERATNGTIEHQNGATGESPTNGAGLTTTGVFVGCQYDDSNGQTQFSQWYKGDALNTNAFAYVITDPNQVYQIEGAATYVQTSAGLNMAITGFAEASGSTSTGLSGASGLTPATTNSLALRVLGPADQSNFGLDVLVRINPAVLRSENMLGI